MKFCLNEIMQLLEQCEKQLENPKLSQSQSQTSRSVLNRLKAFELFQAELIKHVNS